MRIRIEQKAAKSAKEYRRNTYLEGMTFCSNSPFADLNDEAVEDDPPGDFTRISRTFHPRFIQWGECGAQMMKANGGNLVSRRAFVRGGAASVALAGGGLAYGGGVELHWVDECRVSLDLGLGRPLRMVAVSDLHFDPVYEVEYLAGVMRRIKALRPDVFVITGDLFSHDASRAGDLAEILAAVQARLGTFVALGNHDFWSGEKQICKALRAKGIHVLRNESVALPGYEGCYLTGLESYWAGEPDAGIMEETPEDSRHILLVHEPDPFDEIDDPRVRLQISGHTHGGQVRLPLVGALRLPSWGKNYDEGLFQRDERYLYVNRGLGSLNPHVRVLCRPEVTVFDLG